MNTCLPLVFFALVATVTANTGYNYQQQRPVVNQDVRPLAAFSSNAAPVSVQAPQYFAQPNIVAAPSAQYSQPQFAAPVQSAPNFQQAPISVPQYIEHQQQPQTIVSSNVYIHSAPEETEEISFDQGSEAAPPIRKNYRILFVKAPTHNIRFNVNSIKQAQAANEEKTVIYVLSKKPDIATFQNQLSAIQTEQKAHKPEVYFIKYKTQEEANRAQQEIQAQYEALGGSTNVSDEGFAPITSVIGGGPVNAVSSGSFGGASFSGSSNFAQAASNIQQNFNQNAFQGRQGAASSLNFAVALPSSRYLPAKNK